MSETTPHRPRGETRRAVADLLTQGFSQAEIARRLGVSRPTVCFDMRKLGHPAQTRLGRRYDWVRVPAYYEAGHSARACQELFGFGRNAWADAVARGAIDPRPQAEPLEDLLAVGRRTHRSNLKLRLISGGVKAGHCEICGVSEWQGMPLALHLHHLNGGGADTGSSICGYCARTATVRPPRGGPATDDYATQQRATRR